MLRLFSKGGRIGNGILYGGAEATPNEREPLRSEGPQTYFVETDFGNHMRLSWAEVNEIFTVAGVMDYTYWRQERNYLRDQSNLIQAFEEGFSVSATDQTRSTEPRS